VGARFPLGEAIHPQHVCLADLDDQPVATDGQRERVSAPADIGHGPRISAGGGDVLAKELDRAESGNEAENADQSGVFWKAHGGTHDAADGGDEIDLGWSGRR
jgi:hypothetical protein